MRMRVVALVTTLVIITGWSGAQGAERAAELDSLDRRWIQDELAAKGFDPGPADGQFGPKTRRAIKAWQEAKGYAITGELTKGQAETLLYRGGRRVHTWPNGNRYEGDFVDGKYHGRGVHTWPSGARHKGDFRDNERTGRGIHNGPTAIATKANSLMATDRARDLHVGKRLSLRRQLPQQQANRSRDLHLAHGKRYEGGFVDGEFYGQGIWTLPDGNRYEVEKPRRPTSLEQAVEPPSNPAERRRGTSPMVGVHRREGHVGLGVGRIIKQGHLDEAIHQCETAGGGYECRQRPHADQLPCVAVVQTTYSEVRSTHTWVVNFGGLGRRQSRQSPTPAGTCQRH